MRTTRPRLLLLVSVVGVACTPPEVDDRALADAGQPDGAAPPAPGIYVHASAGMDSPGAGSPEQPCRTIQYAIDSAASPTPVHVAAGTYDESVVLRPGFSLLGGYDAADWGAREVLDREQPRFKTSVRAALNIALTVGEGVDERSLIEGLTLQGGLDTMDHHSYGIYLYDGGSPVIRFNTVHGGQGDTHSYGIGFYGSDAQVVANTIHGGRGELTYGIIVGNGSAPLIAANAISGDQATDTSYGVVVNNAAPLIAGNTIDGGSAGGDAFAIFLFSNATPRIEGNIMLTSGGQARHCVYEQGLNCRPASLIANDLFACPTGLYRAFGDPGLLSSIDAVNALPDSDVRDNISLDPVFTSASDWHLQLGSPAAVTQGGTPVSGAGHDHDGAPRTEPWSMGAFEQDG